MRINLVTPPSVEPVTLAEVKLFARVDITDDDALLTSLITAARRRVEVELRQSLITQTFDFYIDGFPASLGTYTALMRAVGGVPTRLAIGPIAVNLHRPPIQSITSVTYYDCANILQTLDPTTYRLKGGIPAKLDPVYGTVWPIAQPTIDSVIIRCVAGYGDTSSSISENIKLGIKVLATQWYENRTPVGEMPDFLAGVLHTDDHGAYG